MSTARNAPEVALHQHLDRLGRQINADLEAELAVRFGVFAGALKPDLEALLAEIRKRPYPLDWVTQQTTDSNTYAVLRSGPCPAGLLWDTRRVTISAAGVSGNPFSTLANASAVLVKSTLMKPTDSNLEAQFKLINASGPVPNDSEFARGQLWLKAREELAVIVSGAASGVQLTAAWSVEVHLDTEFVEPAAE